MTLARAIETGDLALLPSRRDEDWRWTDLRGLLRVIPTVSPEQTVAPGGPFASAGGDELALVNGGEDGIIADRACGGEARLRLVAASSRTAHRTSVGVEVEDGADLVLLESYESQASGYVAATNLNIVLGKDARMVRVVLADAAADAISVVTAWVTLAPGASFSQTILTVGAKRQRFETHVLHPGAGASLRLDGVYLVGEKRHADLTTVVTHIGKGGTTDQLTKGAVAGQGRAVFQGRIIVQQGADKTDARMGHHALILSDTAEVDAKPELLIHADDVSCAHGNTVGALDDDALFYARQRGIPEAEARAMLTQAHLGEVIDRIKHAAAREVCRAWMVERLGALA